MRLRITLALLALGLMATPTQAALITGLDNTGINVNGSDQDLSYALVSAPGGFTEAYKLTSPGFPIPPWLANDATSNWIVPGSPTTTNHPTGTYVYQLQFDVEATTILSSIVISGRWASDNEGSFSVNGGSAISTTGSTGFGSWTTFTIDSSNAVFNLGTNTVTFTVNNDTATLGNPTGLRVEWTGVAAASSAVPEPSTFAAAALAIGAGAFARARRRRTA